MLFTTTCQGVRYSPHRLFLPILLFLSSFTAIAQPLTAYRDGRMLTYYTQNEYQFHFQDHLGFLWGTDKMGKVIRYDGYEVETFPIAGSDTTGIQWCSNERVRFMEDSGRKIWIVAPTCGLDRFDPRTGQFEHFNDEVFAVKNQPSRFYMSIFEDSRKNVWVGAQYQLYRYSLEKDTFSFGTNFSFPVIVLEDKQGNIWVVDPVIQKTVRKVNFSDQRQSEDFRFPFIGDPKNMDKLAFEKAIIENIRVSSSPEIFLMAAIGNLYTFEVDNRTVTPRLEGLLPGELVYTMFHDGITLVGTDRNRVLQYDHEQHVFLPFLDLPEDLPGREDPVQHIFRTHDGVLWVVTQHRTFQVLPRQSPFQQISFPANLRPMVTFGGDERLLALRNHLFFFTKDGLQPVFPDETGPLPLEFSDEDMAVHLPYGGIVPTLEQAINKTGFKFLEDTLRQALWMVLYQYPFGMKLLRFDMGGRRTYEYFCQGQGSTCFSDQFQEVTIDSLGRLWLAGWAGITCFDPATEQFTNFTSRNGLSGFAALTILSDHNGYIWTGHHSRGISRYHIQENCFDHFLEGSEQKDLLTAEVIRKIYEDATGNIWASGRGLNRYDRETNTFERFFEEDGLPMADVYNMIGDQNGNLWISAQDFLSRFDPSKKVFTTFDQSDGLPATKLRFSSPLQDNQGRLFFPNKDGVLCFHPDSVGVDDRIPELCLREFLLEDSPVKVNDTTGVLSRSIAFTDAITLKYRQNVFTIRYAALEYLHPGKITFAYQLEGFDPGWREVGNNREATYTNLNPGDYLFKVKCRNRHGFSSEPITLAITILPPWYRTWWAYALYTIALLFTLYRLYRFQLNRQLARAETLRLKELDEVKTRLYTNITHEFRTPLAVILGMADQVSSNPQEWLGEGTQMIKQHGRRLLHLVNQMLDLAKLESGSLPVNQVQGDVVHYLRYVAESFQSYAEAEDISLHFQTGTEELIMDHDPEKLLHIVSNLLSNALKFTPADGQVFFRLSEGRLNDNACLQIEVEDSGPGIPPDQLPHIFNRFYQGDDSPTRRGEGTGIGLALTKELVQLLQGTIEVKSQVEEGSTFIVRLPVTRKAPTATSAINLDGIGAIPESRTAPGPDPDPRPAGPEKPLLLIIEDNPDVIRYLQACLKGDYQIRSAENGRAGIEKALELVPDIIISDVMMPEKDGFEVCDTLKQDERTSHIPIVLLTAKADVESKIAGLQRGADAYLPKPFHKEELLAQLANLIEQRRKLQERYRNLDAEPPASGDAGVEIEDAFLQKIRAITEENMAKAEFDIVWLAGQANMGRGQLFRKIKALTGLSPSRFVRFVRLERAKTLLRTTDLNISEIAYDIGFSDPAFFSRTFREEVGQSPTEFREAQQG